MTVSGKLLIDLVSFPEENYANDKGRTKKRITVLILGMDDLFEEKRLSRLGMWFHVEKNETCSHCNKQNSYTVWLSEC